MSPAQCHVSLATPKPIAHRILAANDDSLQLRLASSDELGVLSPELLQRVEVQHEPICRVVRSMALGTPLTDWAYAADPVLDALHQRQPRLMVRRVRLFDGQADGEEDKGDNGRSAVCPLLTSSPRLRRK